MSHHDLTADPIHGTMTDRLSRRDIGRFAMSTFGAAMLGRFLSPSLLADDSNDADNPLTITDIVRTSVRLPFLPVSARNMARELPHWEYFDVFEVRLKSGTIGVGEGSMYYSWGFTSEEDIARAKGKNAARLMWDDSYGPGLQLAFFDAVARHAGVPVHALLGNKVHDVTPVSWWAIEMNADDWLKECELAASQGSYSLTGIAATLTYTPAAAAYTLTADAGAYALTGRAASLIAKRMLVASPGSYVLTGRSAGFNGQRLLSAASGSYSATGRAATLTYTPAVTNYVLTAEAGVYAVTGRDAAFNVAERSAVTSSGAPRKPLILPYRKQEPKTQPPAQPEISASPDKADVALSAIAERIDAVLAKSGGLQAQTDTAIAAATEQAMLAGQEAQKLARQDEEDALIALLLAA